jgi:hypothetical protein
MDGWIGSSSLWSVAVPLCRCVPVGFDLELVMVADVVVSGAGVSDWPLSVVVSDAVDSCVGLLEIGLSVVDAGSSPVEVGAALVVSCRTRIAACALTVEAQHKANSAVAMVRCSRIAGSDGPDHKEW